MKEFGMRCGVLLRGGEVFELVGDVGAGKTTFTKGLARGLAINEAVQSPTFTISRVYHGRDDLVLGHYDFYRLHKAGIMQDELAEMLADPRNITVIEWSEVVAGVLPADRLVLNFTSPEETTREVAITADGPVSQRVLEGLQ